MDKMRFQDVDLRLEDAVHNAMEALGKANKAAAEFDRVSERYMRLRSRAESGRMTTIYKQDKLGVKVQSSGRGGNGDDLLIEVVELSKLTVVQRTLWYLERESVRELIEECCGKGTKEAVVLMARYCAFPAVPFGQIPEKYPNLFQTKNQANAAYRRGITAVASKFYEAA